MGQVEHYYTAKPTSALREHTFTCMLRGYELVFKSASGIFSKDNVDAGTRLLIEHCDIEDSWKVLDLGCGYGIVGIALSKAFPTLNVTFTDVNERAVAFTKENLLMNGVKGVVVSGDQYQNIKGMFDTILLNPPQTAGRKVCLAMITGALNHLKPGGSLQLVARHQKGGKTLSEHMAMVFGNVDTLMRGGGFRIYISYHKA